MCLPLSLRFPILRSIHQNRNRSNNAESGQYPCNNFDDLQLMAFCQTTLNATYALVAENNTPHRVNEDA